jgi:hypothetical protein
VSTSYHIIQGEVVSIDLSEFSANIVHAVLTYVYTAEVVLCNETVGPILKCADELGICSLVHECLEFLSHICVDTAIIFYSIAENYNIEELRECAINFICEHFSEVTAAINAPVDTYLHVVIIDVLCEGLI